MKSHFNKTNLSKVRFLTHFAPCLPPNAHTSPLLPSEVECAQPLPLSSLSTCPLLALTSDYFPYTTLLIRWWRIKGQGCFYLPASVITL